MVCLMHPECAKCSEPLRAKLATAEGERDEARRKLADFIKHVEGERTEYVLACWNQDLRSQLAAAALEQGHLVEFIRSLEGWECDEATSAPHAENCRACSARECLAKLEGKT